MSKLNKQAHWEDIYKNKNMQEVSWYQSIPTISLELLKEFNISKTAKIIDIGGGDSFFVDNLLSLDYKDISVLDISVVAINKAKQRLGEDANKVKWIVADMSKFIPTEKYDFWHDRAAFHFLTQEQEISIYIDNLVKSINIGGALVIGTFSEQGPERCSGIEIKQYSDTSLTLMLEKYFEKVNSVNIEHKTPFDTIQNFIFCSFRRKED